MYVYTSEQNMATGPQGSFVKVKGKECWITTGEWRRLLGGGGIQRGLWRIHRVLLEKLMEHVPGRGTGRIQVVLIKDRHVQGLG